MYHVRKNKFFQGIHFLVRFRYFWISEKMKCFETDGLFFSPIWNKPICNNPIFLHSRLIVFIMHHIGARYNIFLSFFLSFYLSFFLIFSILVFQSLSLSFIHYFSNFILQNVFLNLKKSSQGFKDFHFFEKKLI